jgi:hypothetical protein
MPSDRSRQPDPPSDAYTGVAMQQGRVLLDRDFNAERDILDYRDRVTARDEIGPCGTLDNGFAISAMPRFIVRAANAIGNFSPPILFSPPAPDYDLRIGAGTMYVGGLRVEFPARPGGTKAEYTYFAQPDWLAPDPPSAPKTEIVWLQLDEQEISATEDPDLLEVSLGGPDTTQRLRLSRTVRRAAAKASSCLPAWQALEAQWKAQGVAFDGRSSMRAPTARMQVAFTQAVASSNPCDPVAAGGYLFSENQLIRVKWTPPAAGATQGALLWGYDNASFICRVSVGTTGKQLSLMRQPPDAYHFPGRGQYVEVLRTTALIGAGVDAAAEDGSGLIPRCVAESTGFVTTLSAAYDPTGSANMLMLTVGLPDDYVAAAVAEPLFVRIWQGGHAMGPAGGSMELADPVTGASNGLEVTITVPAGGGIAPGAFWMMAVRPGTPQTIWPAALLASPQAPDGPRSWACPLAVVEWPDGDLEPKIHDCRSHFDNLVTLTARPEGCCTVSLSPADITIDRTLQTVVDGMTKPGTLCLAPGVYSLQAPLRIGASQGLTIVAENGATLSAESGFESAFSDGLVVVAGPVGVTLRGLTLVPPAVAAPAGLFGDLEGLVRIALPGMKDGLGGVLKQLQSAADKLHTMIGLRAAGCPELTVEDCSVTFAAPAPAVGGPLFGVGLLASGSCAQLAVRGCRFDATGLPPTQTPALTQASGFLDDTDFVQGKGDGVALQGAIGVLGSPCAAQFLDKNDDAFTAVPDFTGAVIEDNVFSNAIIAVSAFGPLDGARIIDNTISSSSAGVWLRPTSSGEEAGFSFTTQEPRSPVLAGDTMWLKFVLLQKETFLTWLLGLLLPLPAGAATAKFTSPFGNGSLRVSGNAVAALAGAGTDGQAGGMPALAIVNGALSGPTVDVGPGLVVAENRLQARTPPLYPASVLAVSGRLAVTGNLMSNEPAVSFASTGVANTGLANTGVPSTVALAIYPYDNILTGKEIQPRGLCVTGNVLEGSSNLNILIRPDAGAVGLVSPFNTWLPFNANA